MGRTTQDLLELDYVYVWTFLAPISTIFIVLEVLVGEEHAEGAT